MSDGKTRFKLERVGMIYERYFFVLYRVFRPYVHEISEMDSLKVRPRTVHDAADDKLSPTRTIHFRARLHTDGSERRRVGRQLGQASGHRR